MNVRASKSGRFSLEIIGCLWNVSQCVIIILWRGNNHKAEHADAVDNFFRLGFCLSLFLTNIVIAGFLLTTFHHRIEKHRVTLLLKYGLTAPTVIHILSVLFGAPFLKYWDQTISFSVLGSALILPSVVCSGKLGNFSNNFSGFMEWIGLDELWTCLGAWLGAFVIPLDWDRPWQVWPEPCCVGAVLGCGLSSLLKLMRPLLFGAAGYEMYWPTQFFVHERLVL